MRTRNPETYIAIENFIDEYKNETGSSPSTKEIADAVGLSTSGVGRYLQDMRAKGIIEYEGHRNITTLRQKSQGRIIPNVPLVGSVACGTPILAEQNIEEYVRLPEELFGRGEFFFLRAKGNSMINVGIDNGDLVLIRKQSYAERGQIIVALLNDEATLKRYLPDEKTHKIILRPENNEMNDFEVDDLVIQGVAIRVIKDLERQ